MQDPQVKEHSEMQAVNAPVQGSRTKSRFDDAEVSVGRKICEPSVPTRSKGDLYPVAQNLPAGHTSSHGEFIDLTTGIAF